MTYVVTGATGNLGRLAVEALLRRGVPAAQITATGRRIDTLADLAAEGVNVRRADYTDPDSLREAFVGAKRLLLVSSSEVGNRVQQHVNVVRAATDAGVSLIAYTSIPKADTSTLLLAEEHRATEALLAESGIAYVLLRNGWYIENYTSQLPVYLEHNIAGAASAGCISGATRADLAEASAVVLTQEGHAGATYELGGMAFTMTELAEVISKATGQVVSYTDLAVEEYEQLLVSAGLPPVLAAVIADGDRGAAQGELYVNTTDLEQLLGRPAAPLADVVSQAVAALGR
jgi:NAD(P)H dehydrogenase (quinone)